MSLSKIHNRWSFLTLGIFGIITQSKRISIQIPRPPSHSPSVRQRYSPRYNPYLHSLSFSPRLNQSNYTVERELTVQLPLCLSRSKKTIANTQSLRRPWRLIRLSAFAVSIHTSWVPLLFWAQILFAFKIDVLFSRFVWLMQVGLTSVSSRLLSRILKETKTIRISRAVTSLV